MRAELVFVSINLDYVWIGVKG